jgi:GR25 family glycosyltransferase involved in LPS biosynthesis
MLSSKQNSLFGGSYYFDRNTTTTTTNSTACTDNNKLSQGFGGTGQQQQQQRVTAATPAAASAVPSITNTRRRKIFRMSHSSSLYLILASVVSWLAYNNIKSMFLLEAGSVLGSSSDYYDEYLIAPNLATTPSSSSQLESSTRSAISTVIHHDAVTTNNSSSVPRSLHIYWLTGDDDSSSQRSTTAVKNRQRERMETAFRTLRLHSDETRTIEEQGIVTKIPWWTIQEVMEIYRAPTTTTSNETQSSSTPGQPRLLLTNDVILKRAEDTPKAPAEYSFNEAARLVTHLTALVEAYNVGHEQVLIVQDDAILTQAFFDHWHAIVSAAPKEWTVLQWATSNLAALEQSASLPEQWISWLPDLWGTHAYLMNRNGLEAIRKRLAKELTVQRGVAEKFYMIDDQFKHIFLADEIMFSIPYQHAYTSTFPWIISDEIQESINKETPFGAHFKESPPLLPLPDDPSRLLTTRNETLLVFMNIRFATSKRMGLEMDRAISDMESVCKVHRVCEWIIHGVFTHDYLYKRFAEKYESTLPSTIIHFEKTLGTARFNKFGLLKEHLSKMSQYDLVLVKDNDQRLTGFPWASFLEQKGNSLVAGPLRQAPEESFIKTKLWDKSQHYKLHDAQGWKRKGFAPWSTPLFVNATAIEVPFLEMYFNVFDGNYAEWFFSQILTNNFTQQDSCWGPDFLWCPAAKEYAEATGQGHRMGCVLVPFVSVHEDTRQIKKDGEAFNERGYAAVENLRNSNPAFGRWYNVAYKYARGVIAWRQLDGISKHCRSKLLPKVYKANDSIDFAACRDAGLARKNIV